MDGAVECKRAKKIYLTDRECHTCLHCVRMHQKFKLNNNVAVVAQTTKWLLISQENRAQHMTLVIVIKAVSVLYTLMRSPLR